MAKLLIVGAGFSGCTFARVCANAGIEVTILDKRTHIGGNAYDEIDSNGILVHRYGPHIFHANDRRIIEFLSPYTDWRFYEHRVNASLAGELYPFPINRITLEKLFQRKYTETDAQEYFNAVKIKFDRIATSEDVVLSSVGSELCDLFFCNYTRKQWGLELNELAAGVAARIPVRVNDDDRYFTDTYQFMPANGYTRLFENLLDHDLITVRLGEDYFDLPNTARYDHMVFTGPIDRYFDYQYGRLQYRSLRFEHEHIAGMDQYQQVGTVNHPNEHEYTRITEFKHLTGQHHPGTSIVREYPQAVGDPYYPIPRPENKLIYQKYHEASKACHDVTFVGRLAEYKYYNMDQVIASALVKAKKVIGTIQ